ncbi:5-formyltetrahydrofolate cyclo-ligase [Alicyclobacillus sp. TC]|uniref:5-formyltetrahydrofolate cyclo-ligase n=1 Tax=Alicyclobacillus tolerans TaxID=90970 RepID=A0A1M6R0Y9_9BACL|nr:MULTISPECIES: 5-formyltetrahydrofolate cyclo-ligase [Alicyclobacillus]QRF22448.1 5-formyltetrahydrofolate cyclo-ligase [Alicyclobacillus sp. TC]SHK26018.1 5-formyltetrahydrofolate cyclo-ligase [Alicyclobacillus montanus]
MAVNPREDKQRWRSQMLRLRQTLTVPERQYKDEQICGILESFLLSRSWPVPHSIGLYRSMRGEVNLFSLLERPSLAKWIFAFPAVESEENRQMRFYRAAKEEDFQTGHYGIREPLRNEQNAVEPQNFALLLVPGLAFTESGVRLGYGGGYYDRVLAVLPPSVLKIGVLYAVQRVADLPAEAHDVRMDMLLDENGVVSCCMP